MSRRAKIILTGLAVVLAGAIIAAGIFSNIGPARKYIAAELRRTLGRRGVTFENARLGYTAAHLSVVLEDVVAQSPDAPNLPAMVRVPEVRLILDLPALLRGRYIITSAVLVHPAFHVVVTPFGNNIIPVGDVTANAKLEELTASGGSLLYENQRANLSVTLPEWSAGIAPESGGKLVLTFDEKRPGTLRTASGAMPVQDVKLKAVVDTNSVNIDRFGVYAPGFGLLAEGAIGLSEPHPLDITFTATLAPGKLLERLVDAAAVEGDVHVRGKAVGTLSNPDISAGIEADNLQVENVKDIRLTGRAVYDAQGKRVSIPSFLLKMLSGSAAGDAAVALSPGAGRSTADARLEHVDVRAISGLANAGCTLASFASGTVHATWPALHYRAASVTARLNLRAMSLAPRAKVLPVNADLTMTLHSGDLLLDVKSFQALAAKGSARITVSNLKRLGGSVHARSSDIGATLADLERLLGRPVNIKGISGPARLTLELAGTIGQPSVNFEVAAPGATAPAAGGQGAPSPALHPPRAGVPRHPVRSVPLAARLPPAFLELVDTAIAGAMAARFKAKRLETGDAAFARAVAAALRPDPGSQSRQRQPQQDAAPQHQPRSEIVIRGNIQLGKGVPEVRAQTEVRNQPLQALLGLAGLPDAPVGGQVSASGAIRGSGRQMRGNIKLTVSGFQYQGELLGTLTAQIELAGNEIRVLEFRLERAPGYIEGNAVYNRATRRFTFEAAASRYSIERFKIPGAVQISGFVNARVKGSGTPENPSFTAGIQIANLSVDGREIGPLTASIDAANHAATVKLQSSALNLVAGAHAAIRPPYPVAFNVALQNTPLAAFPLALPGGLTGTVTATLQGAIPVAQWKQGRATMRIENMEAVYRGVPVRIAQPPAVVAYDNGVLTFEPSTFLAGPAQVYLAGWLPVERPAAQGRLQVGIRADLRALSAMLPLAPGAAACGTLTVNAAVSGSVLAPMPEGNIRLANGCLRLPDKAPEITNAALDASLENGAITIDSLAADWAGGHVQARGTVPMGMIPLSLPVRIPMQQGAAELALDVTGLNLKDLPGVPPEIAGVVSVHVDARAPHPGINAIEAEATFSKLQLEISGAPFRQAKPSAVKIANGTARFMQLALIGPETTLEVSGTAGIAPPFPLDIRVDGRADAALAALATEAVRARGPIKLKLAIAGTASQPKLDGTAQLSGVQMAVPSPGIQVDDLDALFRFAGERVTVERLHALVNGGTASAGGAFFWTGGAIAGADLAIEAKDVYLSYPQGFKTISNASLRLRSRRRDFVLTGRIAVLDGTFREQLTLERLLSLSRVRDASSEAQRESPGAGRLRLNIELDTEAPIVVDNNLARISALANLRVTNTLAAPGLTGRIDIEEGGELYLAEHTYVVQHGIVQFADERRIRPAFDVLATTESSNFEITLALTGEIGKVRAQFTSQPPLPEPDIISLLLTGRTLQDVRGTETQIASEEALSYISGQLASTLGRQAERVFGLTRVRVEPNLIVADANPTARLTLGEQITHQLNLVYSMDLTNSADQIWIAEYDLAPRFVARGLKQQDNSYRLEFRNTIEFGPVKAIRPWFAPQKKMQIRDISLRGDLHFTGQRLRRVLGLKPGGKYDYFKLHDRLDRLRKFYAKHALLEARIRMQRVEVKKDTYDLLLTVDAGPVVQFLFEGWDAPGRLLKQVRETWAQGVFDLQRVQEATKEVGAALVNEGFVNADVQPQIDTPEPKVKRVIFAIQPETRYLNREIVFSGERGLSHAELIGRLKRQNLLADVYTDAPKAVDALSACYRDNGYLDARVSLPDYLLDPERKYARVTIAVDSGPHYRLSRLVFEGNSAVPDRDLHEVIPKGVLGQYYRPDLRAEIYALVQEYYWKHGYTNVDATCSLTKYPAAGIVDLVFRIDEGKQHIVQAITVSGTEITSPSLVRGEVKLKTGEPLDLEKLAESRSNLYGTGAYWLVDITHKPASPAGAGRAGGLSSLEQAAAAKQARAGDAAPEPAAASKPPDGEPASGVAPAAPRSGASAPGQLPVRLAVNVKEIEPFSLRYGGLYDTERGPGGIVDFANRNSLGAARVLGLRLQYDSELRDARVYFSQPSTSGFFLKTAAAIYAQRQAVEPFITHRYGFTISEDAPFTRHDLLTFGYRVEQASARYINPAPGLAPPENQRVAPLSATYTRETRNSFLNPTRGGFISNSLEYGSKYTGSQERYIKYFGQYLRYVPLSGITELPLAPSVWRSRWIYAGAVRLGLAGGLSGQQLIATERFFAGGATSVRGYDQNSLGPKDSAGNPVGGNAEFIINNELRFPLYNILGGAVFLDAGNVYSTVGTFDPLRLRYGAGAGLRLNTPYLLLRFDAAFKLFRKPGESLTKFYFSIGQAF